jgi:hypothetical protein
MAVATILSWAWSIFIYLPVLRAAPSILKARQVASETSLTWTMINRATRFLDTSRGLEELLGEKLQLGPQHRVARLRSVGKWI